MTKRKREDTVDDVDDPAAPNEVVAPRSEPVTTFDELCERYLPTLAARIWTTCRWPERMADGWNIGDFRFIVIAVSPEPETQLYVQFWSEPHEPVPMEVCSGEWSPPSLKYVQREQRKLLQSLGFRKSGEAKNFGKEVTIANAAQAEAAAREALWIFYEAFGYRGQWPLELRLERGTRADVRPVHESLTPEDFAKLLAEHGYHADLQITEDSPVILARRARRHFTVRLDWQVPGNNLYAAMLLDTLVDVGGFVSDEGLVALTLQLPGMALQRFESEGLRLSMAIRLEGGVTDAWIVHSVSYFLDAVRQCERLLRAATKQASKARRTAPPEPIH
jgi:hypothetical protein